MQTVTHAARTMTSLMDNSPSYNESLKDCCTEGAYSSIWTIMALSSVVGLPINSVYPPMNGPECKPHLGLSKQFETKETRNRETLTILWSRMGPWRPPNWTGNHFVPILKQQQQPPLQTTVGSKPHGVDEKKENQQSCPSTSKATVVEKKHSDSNPQQAWPTETKTPVAEKISC